LAVFGFPLIARTGAPNVPFEHLTNRVLAALVPTDGVRWRQHLELVEWPSPHAVLAPDVPLDFIYFPETALVGLVHAGGKDGVDSPVALVGNDGVVGVAPWLGTADPRLRAEVLHPGHAWRLPVGVLGSVPPLADGLLRVAMRYLQALNAQMSQAALCRLQHTPDQRLCRWLQDAFDRVPHSTLQVAPAALSGWLGIDPDAVNRSASQLAAEGALSTGDSEITLLDRALLARRSCACHQLVKQQTDQLLPPIA
jgi:CRP-like cAMP-binding protein